MTIDEFIAYQYTIKDKGSDFSEKVYLDAMSGKVTVNNDFIKLKAILVYIRIIEDYWLDNSVEDDNNMFTREEMKLVINHLNKLCNTNFNINLILDE